MNKDFYLVKFTINNVIRYLIWYTNEVDGFVTCDSRIALFKSYSDVIGFCKHNKIDVFDEVTEFNFDSITDSLGEGFDSSRILDFWNIASDFASTVKIPFEGDDARYHILYAKLVKSCGLSALNGGSDIVAWSDEEQLDIKTIIADGALIIEQYIIKNNR